MRVVRDKNAIVSGLNFPGYERLILEHALRGRLQLYQSPFILDADAGVLARKFNWSADRTSQALRALRDAATIVELFEAGHADNRILECAVAASADYLVIGDRRHLLPLKHHQGATILNAPRFLSVLEER